MVRLMGLLIDEKQKHKRWVFTEEKLDDIEARLEYTPRKSLKHLAQETGVSKSSARWAITVLHASQSI
jgi:predicted transcriptional regulator